MIIGGNGIGAKGIAVVVAGAITAINLVDIAPLASALPLVFTPSQDVFVGTRRNYVIDLLENDVLDARISSNVTGTSTVASCKVFQAKLTTKRSLIKYNN